MFDDELSQLIADNDIADLLLDMCSVLYSAGVHQVHVGGLLRVFGIDLEQAAKHDDTYFELDRDFAKRLQALEYLDETYEVSVDDAEDNHPPTIH